MSAQHEPSKKRAPLPMEARLAYRVDDAAEVLGVSRSTIYELVGRGELELGKIAGRSVIPTKSLRAYFERRYEPVKPAA